MLLPCMHADLLEAGCDEAGRGCLAGPVVAAAVILPADFRHPVLNDSKLLVEHQREELKEVIMQQAIAWAIGVVGPEEIDQINILNASIRAMHLAVAQLSCKPQHLLIDGNRFHAYDGISHTCVIKGDGKYLNIAAASVLAKTHRDQLMREMDEDYPGYGWSQNKGYPTPPHRRAIATWGVTPHHRMSFQLLPRQLSLFAGENYLDTH